MYTCKYASQGLYDRLNVKYGTQTFNSGKSFDDMFAEFFDFEADDVNPGWSDASLAADDTAEDHAEEYLCDHMD